MARSLFVSLVLVIVSLVVVVAAVTIVPNRSGATSAVVSTHDSSGLDVRATSPNPNAHGRSVVVAPDPYRQTPIATCEVPYVETTGSKAVLKYGTTQHCGNESAPQPDANAEVNA